MTYDYCIVGGGIVGLATAIALLESEPDVRIILLEKEPEIGLHQTSRNSGVIHAGIYYKPGSLKARLCREGERSTKEFCTEHNIPFRTPGKLIVATDALELHRMGALEENAAANNIPVTRIDAAELRRMEPNIRGEGALFVRSTGIVDYRQVAGAMASKLRAAGVGILCGQKVQRIVEQPSGVDVIGDQDAWSARKVVVCAGLQADRIARDSGVDINFRIIPFRGEYYRLPTEKEKIVTRMIYPVPDPKLPFLGIHLTPLAEGGMSVGPNAVFAGARENYTKFSVSGRDLMASLLYPGFWRLIGQHFKAGVDEFQNSISKSVYLKKCQKYCPDLEEADLLPYRAGIRAQAVTRKGEMIHDFHFDQTARVLYVGNAPSPAATSAIPIGRMIASRLRGTPTQT